MSFLTYNAYEKEIKEIYFRAFKFENGEQYIVICETVEYRDKIGFNVHSFGDVEVRFPNGDRYKQTYQPKEEAYNIWCDLCCACFEENIDEILDIIDGDYWEIQ